ncbi:MAG: stage V sporulation protein AD [Clostridia bacterium]|nr:stage V sporulation protein AD [Clostridia bacterium]
MKNKPVNTDGAAVVSVSSVVGKKEYDGPLGEKFDVHDETDRFGQKTFELSESEMQREAMSLTLGKAGLSAADIGAVFAGDLLNQCVGSAYGLIEYDVPYFGLYGACSTAAEGLTLAAMLTSKGIYDRCMSVTSSHNASAERQYRNPLEYGGQRPPTAQWTVTGSGAYLVEGGYGKNSAEHSDGLSPMAYITEVMPGIVVQKGVTDLTNMGAAMAPAAVESLLGYFDSTGTGPDDFDLIITGDLGFEGTSILREILAVSGKDPGDRLTDCGMLIYDRYGQDVHSGGSGCGCSSVVLAAHFLPMLKSGELNDVLFLGTGAMSSPAATRQGQVIPGVAHLLRLMSPAAYERGAKR